MQRKDNTMHEYEVRSQAGEPLALLEALDFVDAELFAIRKFGGAARVVSLPSSEAAETELREAWRARGLSEAEAEIAWADTVAALRPARRFRVPRQHAQLSGIAPKGKTLAAAGNIHGLSEAGTEGDSKALEESWKHLHPTWSPDQIKLATTGR